MDETSTDEDELFIDEGQGQPSNSSPRVTRSRTKSGEKAKDSPKAKKAPKAKKLFEHEEEKVDGLDSALEKAKKAPKARRPFAEDEEEKRPFKKRPFMDKQPNFLDNIMTSQTSMLQKRPLTKACSQGQGQDEVGKRPYFGEPVAVALHGDPLKDYDQPDEGQNVHFR